MRISGDEGELIFESVRSVYLSIGPGAGVLKSWKKSASPALDAFLRLQVRQSFARIPQKKKPCILLPIPQSADRKWLLDGGSTLRFTEMIAAASRNAEVFELLALDPDKALGESNQARSKGDVRYSRRPGIRAKTADEIGVEHPLMKRILAGADEDPEIFIVDDFLTSGATLRASLKEARSGFEALGLFSGRRTRISAFVLGFRPTLFV